MKPLILSAGVVIVRGLQPLYLLLRAYQYWDFPKGMVEPGEEPLQAAIREVREETGLEALDFHWGPVFKQTRPYGIGKVARYYLARAEAGEVYLPVNPQLGRPEHEEFRWVDYASAKSLTGGRLRPILNWAHRLATG